MDSCDTAREAPNSGGTASTDALLVELLEVQKAMLAELRLLRAGLASLEKRVAGRPEIISSAPAVATSREQPPGVPEGKDSRQTLVQAIIARNKARAKGGTGSR